MGLVKDLVSPGTYVSMSLLLSSLFTHFRGYTSVWSDERIRVSFLQNSVNFNGVCVCVFQLDQNQFGLRRWKTVTLIEVRWSRLAEEGQRKFQGKEVDVKFWSHQGVPRQDVGVTKGRRVKGSVREGRRPVVEAVISPSRVSVSGYGERIRCLGPSTQEDP